MLLFSDKDMHQSLNELTVTDARKLLDNNNITALELTEACLLRIKELNRKLNVCITISSREARAEANQADKRLRSGERGDLLGIPFLVKDNIMTKGVRTTAASKMLEKYIAPYDATVVAKLKEAGAIMLGKTNLDEFAHGASTEYSYFGATKNPYNTKYAPGGSSGGSAVAVATNTCLFALGTDTGGSVRHPASFCGVVGLKPTYGLASRHGLIAMTSSTDVPGVLAKNAHDAKLVLETIMGHDHYDATTTNLPLTEAKDFSQLTIGIVNEYQASGADGAIVKRLEEVVHWLKEQGLKVIDISLPNARYGVSVYYIITPAEISSNLARFDGLRYGHRNSEVETLSEEYLANRGDAFGDEVKRRIMLGTHILSSGYHDAYYLKAQQVRTKIINDFDDVFSQVDLILAPSTPSTAFKLGSQSGDPLKMYLEDYFLTPASLAGLPAVSFPVGMVNDLPIGLQLIGPKLSELNILSLVNEYENAFDKTDTLKN